MPYDKCANRLAQDTVLAQMARTWKFLLTERMVQPVRRQRMDQSPARRQALAPMDSIATSTLVSSKSSNLLLTPGTDLAYRHCVGGSEEEETKATCTRTDRNYNIPLRIGLLFAILVTSFIG